MKSPPAPPRLRCPLLSKWREELCQRQAQSRRQLRRGRDANIALAPFHAADVIAVEAGPCRQILLRHTPVSAQFTDSPPNGDWQLNGHARYRGGLNTTGLHTIVFMIPQASKTLPGRDQATGMQIYRGTFGSRGCEIAVGPSNSGAASVAWAMGVRSDGKLDPLCDERGHVLREYADTPADALARMKRRLVVLFGAEPR